MAGWGFRSVQLGLLRSGLVPTKLQKGLVGGQSGLSTEAVRATCKFLHLEGDWAGKKNEKCGF